MTQSQGHASAAVFSREGRSHVARVATEVLPTIGFPALGLGGVAVAPGIHREHPVAGPQALGDLGPHACTESVGVVQKGQGTPAPPVDQGDLDAGTRELDPTALYIPEHGGRF